MSSTAWQLPGAPLRRPVIGVYAAAFALVALLAVGAERMLALSALYPLKAMAIFGLIAAIGLGFVQTRHPFSRFGFANTVTTGRALAVALIAALVGEPAAPVVAATAAGVTALVALLDGVDGWLARRSGLASAFGARFDMEIDALLILALSLLVWQDGKAGAWIVLAGALRYVFIAAGWWLPWMRRPLVPLWRRKLVCVLQIVGLGIVMLPNVTPPLSVWLSAVLLAGLSYSFLADTVRLWHAVE